jgi:hypothetical protein
MIREPEMMVRERGCVKREKIFFFMTTDMIQYVNELYLKQI